MMRSMSKEERDAARARLVQATAESVKEPFPEVEHESASREVGIDEFVGDRKKKKGALKRDGTPRANGSAVKRAMEDAHIRMHLMIEAHGNPTEQARVWEGADHRAIVGLYAMWHKGVYGVEAMELATDWLPACSTAKWLLLQLGNLVVAARFMQFVWSRIKKQIDRHGPPERRVGWRLAFSRQFVSDYRTNQVLKHRPRRTASR